MESTTDELKKYRLTVTICKAVTFAVFVAIIITNLVILSVEVHNDMPTIAAGYSQMDDFLAPVISVQLKNNFTITCHFLFLNVFGKNILSYGTRRTACIPHIYIYSQRNTQTVLNT